MQLAMCEYIKCHRRQWIIGRTGARPGYLEATSPKDKEVYRCTVGVFINGMVP